MSIVNSSQLDTGAINSRVSPRIFLSAVLSCIVTIAPPQLHTVSGVTSAAAVEATSSATLLVGKRLQAPVTNTTVATSALSKTVPLGSTLHVDVTNPSSSLDLQVGIASAIISNTTANLVNAEHWCIGEGIVEANSNTSVVVDWALNSNVLVETIALGSLLDSYTLSLPLRNQGGINTSGFNTCALNSIVSKSNASTVTVSTAASLDIVKPLNATADSLVATLVSVDVSKLLLSNSTVTVIADPAILLLDKYLSGTSSPAVTVIPVVSNITKKIGASANVTASTTSNLVDTIPLAGSITNTCSVASNLLQTANLAGTLSCTVQTGNNIYLVDVIYGDIIVGNITYVRPLLNIDYSKIILKVVV